MMKSGAPPDKFGVLYRLLPIEFHGFTSRINSKGAWSYLNFLEMVWVRLRFIDHSHKDTCIDTGHYICNVKQIVEEIAHF